MSNVCEADVALKQRLLITTPTTAKEHIFCNFKYKVSGPTLADFLRVLSKGVLSSGRKKKLSWPMASGGNLSMYTQDINRTLISSFRVPTYRHNFTFTSSFLNFQYLS